MFYLLKGNGHKGTSWVLSTGIEYKIKKLKRFCMKMSIIIITKIVKGRHKTHLRHCLKCSGFVEGVGEGVVIRFYCPARCTVNSGQARKGVFFLGGGGGKGGCMILGRGRARTCTYLAIRLHINRSPCKRVGGGGGGWNSLTVMLRFTCTDPMTLRAYQILCEAAVDHHSHCASESNN